MHPVLALLPFDVELYCIGRDPSDGFVEVSIGPEGIAPQERQYVLGQSPSDIPGTESFEMMSKRGHAISATVCHKYMNVFGAEFYCLDSYTQLMRLAPYQRFD